MTPRAPSPVGAPPRDPARAAGASGIELWAGVECSVTRVGDVYVDEVHRTGHARRLADVDRIAALGARAVRYPVIWERTAPDGPGRPAPFAAARPRRPADRRPRPPRQRPPANGPARPRLRPRARRVRARGRR